VKPFAVGDIGIDLGNFEVLLTLPRKKIAE